MLKVFYFEFIIWTRTVGTAAERCASSKIKAIKIKEHSWHLLMSGKQN